MRRAAGLRGGRLVRRAADRLRRHRGRSTRSGSALVIIAVVVAASSAASTSSATGAGAGPRRRSRRRSPKARANERRRQGARRAHDRSARDAEAVERQANFLYEAALVHHHRPARRRQDHGAGQFRPEVSAGRRRTARASIAGVGGTRYCDWWFTEDAVLIDTAGRYTTQDSDAEADKKSWLSFLSLLKTNRAKQPINGVILAISLEDMHEARPRPSSPRMPTRSASGCSSCTRSSRSISRSMRCSPRPTWSPASPSISATSPRRGGARSGARPSRPRTARRTWSREVPAEFDALVKRLTEELPDRLQEEPDADRAHRDLRLPGAVRAAARTRVAEFLNQIFEPTRYQVNANLRGFYFSSGTQEGTPIDQVLGVDGPQLRRRRRQLASCRARGKSFFLHDLLTKVIFAESGWVSLRHERGAARRDRALWRDGRDRRSSSLGLLGAWGWSYVSNKALIAATDSCDRRLPRQRRRRAQAATTISDVDAISAGRRRHRSTSSCAPCRSATSTRDEPTPLGETFGLQPARPAASRPRETTYRQALERMFRSRLILRLERQIEASMNDPMRRLRGAQGLSDARRQGAEGRRRPGRRLDAQDWEENLYPGPNNRQARAGPRGSICAPCSTSAARHKPTFELNGPLVEAAQRVAGAHEHGRSRLCADQDRRLFAPTSSDFYVAARGRRRRRRWSSRPSTAPTSTSWRCRASTPMPASTTSSSSSSPRSPTSWRASSG